METQFTQQSDLVFQIPAEKISFFTLLLQSGVQISTQHGTSIGKFLETLPGFTIEYIIDEVQTIFLNGTATDDLETKFEGDKATLALSAAMPGLAGAIFRKNSLHAALRTTGKTSAAPPSSVSSVIVTVKLFNAIARDRGAELLRRGVTIRAESISQFFEVRKTLINEVIDISCNDEPLKPKDLSTLLSNLESVHLRLTI